MGSRNVRDYKIVFIAAVLVIGLFAVSPDPVSALCIVDSNCPYYEYCSWGACNPLSCADQRFLICANDAACGAGRYCTAVIDTQPNNHACVSCIGCYECLSC